MTDPRRLRGIDDGGRHTTHADTTLSDQDADPEDYDLSDIYEGWGFDPIEDDDD